MEYCTSRTTCPPLYFSILIHSNILHSSTTNTHTLSGYSLLLTLLFKYPKAEQNVCHQVQVVLLLSAAVSALLVGGDGFRNAEDANAMLRLSVIARLSIFVFRC